MRKGSVLLRILFDVNVPRPVSRFLTAYDVEFADLRGWRALSNGDPLAVAERAGFDILLTADQNLRYQQNPIGRRIAIIALSAHRWDILRADPALITDAVDRARAGTSEDVTLPRPPLQRRRPAKRGP